MNWDEYKVYVSQNDEEAKLIIEEAEAKAQIISIMIKRRNDLGLSQRELAELCGVPQSSIARIESNHSVPRLDMLIRIFSKLGLGVSIFPTNRLIR
ncbi:MAG: helix-turn-helix domain-containing protein [Lachnospiraceae bacterium]|nr:helix-turn-helix domain-containing protein [Lachnospiraceae bacterium]